MGRHGRWMMGSLILVPAIAVEAHPVQTYLETELSLGWRRLNVEWSSGAGTSNPPFTSEWDDLDAIVAGITLKDPGQTLLAFRLWGDYARIVSGTNRHSGYAAVGGTEIYRSDNRADDGWQWRVGSELGMNLRPAGDRLLITPVAGYLAQRLRLSQTDGVQRIPATGAYDDLDSSTITHWHGPQVGVEFRWQANPPISFMVAFRYAWLDFSGQTDWNLRPDLEHPVSLEQEGGARALRGAARIDWQINTRWSCALHGELEDWHTTSGTDQVRVVNGQDEITSLRTFEIFAFSLSLSTGWRF